MGEMRARRRPGAGDIARDVEFAFRYKILHIYIRTCSDKKGDSKGRQQSTPGHKT